MEINKNMDSIWNNCACSKRDNKFLFATFISLLLALILRCIFSFSLLNKELDLIWKREKDKEKCQKRRQKCYHLLITSLHPRTQTQQHIQETVSSWQSVKHFMYLIPPLLSWNHDLNTFPTSLRRIFPISTCHKSTAWKLCNSKQLQLTTSSPLIDIGSVLCI